jgi:hypothetical protein
VPSLEVIIADLAGFLMPHARQALQRTGGRLQDRNAAAPNAIK